MNENNDSLCFERGSICTLPILGNRRKMTFWFMWRSFSLRNLLALLFSKHFLIRTRIFTKSIKFLASIFHLSGNDNRFGEVHKRCIQMNHIFKVGYLFWIQKILIFESSMKNSKREVTKKLSRYCRIVWKEIFGKNILKRELFCGRL